jgi:ferredoxin-NADP reductase/ferredoxin
MFKDLKKFTYARKLKQWREEIQPIPTYLDGLENLCDRLHPDKLWLQISDIKQLSPNAKLYRFIPARSTIALSPFRAGQYIGLTVEINGVRTSRPYSLVSSPNQLAYYELGIKKEEDGFVSPYLFDNAKVGDLFEATGPLGNCYYNQIFHGKNLIFIAGGCGITPFISMLRDFSERVAPINIWLLFGCLTKQDILFREELEDLQKRRSNIKVTFILSEPGSDWTGETGFISKDKILKNIGTIDDKFFYIVGNREMYEFVLKELEDLGVPNHRISHELFGVPKNITQIMGWPKEIDTSKKVQITVEFIKSGRKEKKVFEALCIEPILNSIERAKELGIQINSGCRSGECALCRTKLLSGKVFVPSEVTIREADRDNNFIHPCISYPLQDIHLEILFNN